MNDRIVKFPSNLRPSEPVQMDLFDVDNFLVGKYSFLDVQKSNEKELNKYIDIFKFKLVLDVRIFPSFDRPRFDHKAVLTRFRSKNVLYFPAVYLKYTNNLHKQLHENRRSIEEKTSSGPILVLYEEREGGQEKLHEWRRLIERKVEGSKELHPNMIQRLERLLCT